MELQLGDGTSSHFKSCCIFVLQNISLKFPYGTPYPDQSNLACLEQTPIFHCSKVEAHRCCLSGTNWTPVYQHLGFQNLKPTVNSWISCLAVAEKIWQVFPIGTTHVLHSIAKCIFLTNMTPVIPKKHCYNKEISDQTQSSSDIKVKWSVFCAIGRMRLHLQNRKYIRLSGLSPLCAASQMMLCLFNICTAFSAWDFLQVYILSV